jgi:hypothetical protein
MTGLEVIRAIGSGELPGAPIAELIGFETMEADEGQREDGQAPRSRDHHLPRRLRERHRFIGSVPLPAWPRPPSR